MARIPVNERREAPHHLLEPVITTPGTKQQQLAYPVSALVNDLIEDARALGIEEPLLTVKSGFRSNAVQKQLFDRAVEKYGSVAKARKWVAPPGKSAHNTGFTVDFNLGYPLKSENVNKMKKTRAYKVLNEILAPRYKLSPYAKEPWHWECDSECQEHYLNMSKQWNVAFGNLSPVGQKVLAVGAVTLGVGALTMLYFSK